MKKIQYLVAIFNILMSLKITHLKIFKDSTFNQSQNISEELLFAIKLHDIFQLCRTNTLKHFKYVTLNTFKYIRKVKHKQAIFFGLI